VGHSVVNLLMLSIERIAEIYCCALNWLAVNYEATEPNQKTAPKERNNSDPDVSPG
jgi:hypothetical protein